MTPSLSQFHQLFDAKRKTQMCFQMALGVRDAIHFQPTKLQPTLPVHITRSYAQLICHTLYSACQINSLNLLVQKLLDAKNEGRSYLYFEVYFSQRGLIIFVNYNNQMCNVLTYFLNDPLRTILLYWLGDFMTSKTTIVGRPLFRYYIKHQDISC